MEDTLNSDTKTLSDIWGVHHPHGHHYHLHHHHYLPSPLQCSCILNGEDAICSLFRRWIHVEVHAMLPWARPSLLEPHLNNIQINGHPLVEFQGTHLSDACSVRNILSYYNLKSLQVAKVNLAVPACVNKISSLCGDTRIKCLAHRESL